MVAIRGHWRERQGVRRQNRNCRFQSAASARAEKEEQGPKSHRLERACGRFERCFTLPDEADPEKITSEYEEGILTVNLPKNPNVKTKVGQITVQ